MESASSSSPRQGIFYGSKHNKGLNAQIVKDYVNVYTEVKLRSQKNWVKRLDQSVRHSQPAQNENPSPSSTVQRVSEQLADNSNIKAVL